MMRRLRPTPSMAVALLALVVAVSGGAFAAVKASAPTITVCVRHNGGALYRAKKCAKRDAALSWKAIAGAGGALTGSYPNPALGAGVVSDANVKPNSLTGASINASTLGKVPTAGSADNANTLWGIPGFLFYRPCGFADTDGQNGTVKGKALIEGAKAVGFLSSAGVVSDFVCSSQHVLVQKLAVGFYQVVFGSVVVPGCAAGTSDIGIPSCPSSDFAIASPTAFGKPAGLVVSADGPHQCAPAPPPYITCVDVFVTQLNGTPADGTFTIVLL